MTGAAAVVARVAADAWDGGHMGGGGWMWLWLPLAVLVLVALAGVVGLLVARGVTPTESSPPPERRAREILMERFARGEIDADEYEERLARLR